MAGRRYVPPPRPAPVYGGGYVAPAPVRLAPCTAAAACIAPTPAPVRPAPVMAAVGTWPRPRPVRPAPVYGGGGYAGLRRFGPAYGGGGYVAPTPAPVRPAPVYVPPRAAAAFVVAPSPGPASLPPLGN